MSERCRVLEWDTEFFGFRIARLDGERLARAEVPEIERWCDENDVQCLYFLATAHDAETIRAAEAMGGHLVDVRVTFSRIAEEPRIRQPDGVVARSAQAEDLHSLLPIAEGSYEDSRFFFDDDFPDQKCRELYRKWLWNSFEGHADEVRVATADGRPVGYVTCHLREAGTTGEIGLVGVDETVRGRGVGRLVVDDAVAWFSRQSVQSIIVATQARNVGAQRLYQACGFRTVSVALWYHRWAR